MPKHLRANSTQARANKTIDTLNKKMETASVEDTLKIAAAIVELAKVGMARPKKPKMTKDGSKPMGRPKIVRPEPLSTEETETQRQDRIKARQELIG